MKEIVNFVLILYPGLTRSPLEQTSYIARTINIGHLPMGGTHPVRIQSMTNTDTMDIASTLNQCISLIEAGCELIRITAQGLREAKQLEKIKNELIKKGHEVPLIADIHFNPKAAELAAGLVEKVRINPGNYVDRKGSAQKDYSDNAYREELDRIAERMQPLISICKKNNTAIRIGVNHGSLSERIMIRREPPDCGFHRRGGLLALSFLLLPPRLCLRFDRVWSDWFRLFPALGFPA